MQSTMSGINRCIWLIRLHYAKNWGFGRESRNAARRYQSVHMSLPCPTGCAVWDGRDLQLDLPGHQGTGATRRHRHASNMTSAPFTPLNRPPSWIPNRRLQQRVALESRRDRLLRRSGQVPPLAEVLLAPIQIGRFADLRAPETIAGVLARRGHALERRIPVVRRE